MILQHPDKKPENAYASTQFQRGFRVGERAFVTSRDFPQNTGIETNVLVSRPSFRNPLETAESALRK